jgi:hypothetical protein
MPDRASFTTHVVDIGEGVSRVPGLPLDGQAVTPGHLDARPPGILGD